MIISRIQVAAILVILYIILAIMSGDFDSILYGAVTTFLLSTAVTSSKSEKADIFDIVIITCVFFYLVRPLQSITSGAVTANDSPVGNAYYGGGVYLSLYLSIWTFLVMVAFARRVSENTSYVKYFSVPGVGGGYKIYLILLLQALFLICHAASIGPENIFRPRGSQIILSDAPWDSIFVGGALASSFIIYTLFKNAEHGNVSIFVIFCSLAMQVTISNPFNSARFILILSYLPLLMSHLKGQLGVRTAIIGSIAFALVAMPILNSTTRNGDALSNSDFYNDFFVVKYIDVFEMSLENINYTGVYGHTFGEKFLGDALFFVPRSIWNSKPTLNGLDVGYVLLHQKVAGTDNLSMPPSSDGYRDFGILGSILVSAVIVMYYRWTKSGFNINLCGLNGIEYIAMASCPIILRGPFSSTVPIAFFETVFYIIIIKFISRAKS